MTVIERRWPVTLLSGLLASSLIGGVPAPALAQAESHSLVGPWSGVIQVVGVALSIRVVFSDSASGLTVTIDIPQQGAHGLPLRAVTRDGGSVHFELQTAAPGIFDGRIDGDTISGSFSQGAASGTFTLTRGEAIPPAERVPPPYREEELIVSNGEVSLAGTLTLPEGHGPFPAVVLIYGSGPQTRDEEVAGFKIFRQIADHLTRSGVAVYRYDDRGVGASTGSITAATSADFASDALAAVTRLKQRPEIDGKRVGLLGHSEGASVAAIAATRSTDVSFAVLLAPPGVRGDLLLRQQAADGARALGASESVVATIVAAHQKVTEAAREGAPAEALESALMALVRAQYDSLPEAQRAALGDRETFAARTAPAAAAQLTSPWMRFMLDFDPVAALREVRCPVLAIFGSLDTQVPPSSNEGPVRAALEGNPKAQIKTYAGANHLFQQARTGLVTEYSSLEPSFVAGLMPDVSAWVRAIQTQ